MRGNDTDFAAEGSAAEDVSLSAVWVRLLDQIHLPLSEISS
jgi:hypothetical protein